MSPSKPPSKDVLFYAVSLVGVAVALILVSWFLGIMWYSIFMIHIALTIGVWGVYVILCIYCIYLAYRVIGYIRSRPVKEVSSMKHYVLPAILLLAAAITPFIVLKAPSWIEYDMAPHLSFEGDPAHSMSVTWYSTGSYIGRATYGETLAMNLSVSEAAAVKEHHLAFTSLKNGTPYYYKIDGFSETWSFKTANETVNNTHFIAFSDVHSMFYPTMTPDITGSEPDFVLSVGDMTDIGAWNSDWNKYFDLVKPIATYYPMMTTIGNHDSMFFGDGNYLKYLSMPRASTGSEKYYNFTYNGVHFICLDLEWGTESYDAQQKAWFDATLDNLDASDWIVVFDHCMHVSSGGFGNATGDLLKLYNTAGNVRDTFHQSFYEHGVDLVISGHDHHFEVSEWDGIVYAIVGTANTRLDAASATNNTCSIFYEPDHSGFTEIWINGNTCTISGNLYDANNAPMTPFTHEFTRP
jgi:UDP-2,3-diacylglucosamine pyrophosphatase LpxH